MASRGDLFAAIDLGATSGRVIVGEVDGERITATECSRFENRPVRVGGLMQWDVLSLWADATTGLARAAAENPGIRSVAVDTWGVDVALTRGERLLGNPVHYRDTRTDAVIEQVHALVPPEELFSRAGVQPTSINTIYQLVAEQSGGLIDAADGALLMPDVFSYWFTGERIAERTMASTTGLLSAETGDWDRELLEKVGIPTDLFARVVPAGTRIGPISEDVVADLGLTSSIDVVATAAHDTAAAVVATPLPSRGGVFVSCGTWGLIGVERDRPLLGSEAFSAGVTNERGLDDRYLVMRNGMGLWILSETLRGWDATDELTELLARATALSDAVPVFDVEDPRFQIPGDMPARIAAWCEEHGVAPPQGRVAIVRSIIESLAHALAASAHEIGRLTDEPVTQVNIVGGGSRNELLCARVADLAGVPVYAGPNEATALGSLLVQARTAGTVNGTVDDLRAIVTRTIAPRQHLPGARHDDARSRAERSAR